MHSGLLSGPLCHLTTAYVTENTSACCPAVWMTAFWRSARPPVRHGRSEEGRGAMALSLDAAAEVFREAMRDTVKRYSLWYLIQGVLLIAAGVLASADQTEATCRISGCSSSPSSWPY